MLKDWTKELRFSPPCGEKLKYQMLCLKTINTGFSSPYGDKSKWYLI